MSPIPGSTGSSGWPCASCAHRGGRAVGRAARRGRRAGRRAGGRYLHAVDEADVDVDVRVRLRDVGERLLRRAEADEFDAQLGARHARAPRLEDVHRRHRRRARHRHRVEDEDGLHRDPLRQLVVVLDRQQRLLVAVDPEVPHLRVAAKLRHRLDHPEPAAQHRHDAHPLRDPQPALGAAERLHVARLERQVLRRLVAQERRHLLDQRVEVLWARRRLPHLRDLVHDQRVPALVYVRRHRRHVFFRRGRVGFR